MGYISDQSPSNVKIPETSFQPLFMFRRGEIFQAQCIFERPYVTLHAFENIFIFQ